MGLWAGKVTVGQTSEVFVCRLCSAFKVEELQTELSDRLHQLERKMERKFSNVVRTTRNQVCNK